MLDAPDHGTTWSGLALRQRIVMALDRSRQYTASTPGYREKRSRRSVQDPKIARGMSSMTRWFWIGSHADYDRLLKTF